MINIKFKYTNFKGFVFLKKLKGYDFVLFFLILGFSFLSQNIVVAREIESPYGPIKPLNFEMYREYFADRSLKEYEGSEYGAGVVTDLVFSLTEENLEKKRAETTTKDKFIHFCGPCHGNNGNGEGKFVATGVTPAPRNISDSSYMATLSDDNIFAVISGGSQSVGKSNLCPPWGKTFDKSWISDMVAFVRTLVVSDTAEVAVVQDTTALTTDKSGEASVDEESGDPLWRWIALGFATTFFITIAVLEWGLVLKKK